MSDKDLKPRVEATGLKATIKGVEYKWFGGFGAVIQSIESGIKLGHVRMIGNVIFYAYLVSKKGFRKHEISWCPQQQIDAEWIRAFKQEVFK